MAVLCWQVLDKTDCTAEPQQEGLSSAASQSLLHMTSTLSTTDTKDQQLLADIDAHIEVAPLPLKPPQGSSSASQVPHHVPSLASSVIEKHFFKDAQPPVAAGNRCTALCLCCCVLQH